VDGWDLGHRISNLYVKDNIVISFHLYLINDVQGKFPFCSLTHINKSNPVSTFCTYLYDLSNEYTPLFTVGGYYNFYIIFD
jgi:hypothetical protein